MSKKAVATIVIISATLWFGRQPTWIPQNSLTRSRMDAAPWGRFGLRDISGTYRASSGGTIKVAFYDDVGKASIQYGTKSFFGRMNSPGTFKIEFGQYEFSKDLFGRVLLRDGNGETIGRK